MQQSSSQFGEAFNWFISELKKPAPKQTWFQRNKISLFLLGTVLALVGVGILIGKFVL